MMKEIDETKMKVGLVLLPPPIIGHLVSTVELSKRLIEQDHHHRFSITILNMHLPLPTAASSVINAYVESEATSGSHIRFIQLPPIVPQFSENQTPEAFLSRFIESHKNHVKDAIAKQVSDSPSVGIAALIIDFFCTPMIDVAKELGIPTYIYFTSGAAFLGLMLHLPTLHETIPSNLGDFDGEIDVPGMPPLPPIVVPSSMQTKNNDGYEWFLYHARRFREAKGIIVNTFGELEPRAIEELKEGKKSSDHPIPAVFPIGPLLDLQKKDPTSKHPCIEWLDEQPPGSVLFLCFGSMGSFPGPQIKEIALGLECSGHRFLWSLRCPSRDNLPVDANLAEVLPEGFLDQTNGRGLVWPSWVPQVAVLAHEAIGGFVSHCGWNSTLESLWFGVPILAWPLYAEQKFNAFQLVKDLGVAVEFNITHKSGSLVSAQELEKAVRCLMDDCEQGKKVRGRVKEMCRASRKAVEEGGNSLVLLKQLMDELTEGSIVPAAES